MPLPDPTPEGGSPIAMWDENINEQIFVNTGNVLEFYAGYPQIVPREASVMIQGQESFQFPAHTQHVVQTYQASPNDEVQNPVFFNWRVLDAHGLPSTRAQLSSTRGQSVQVTFDVMGINPLIATVEVSMDDDLHLTDSSGKPPTAQLKVTGTPFPPLPHLPPPPPPPPHHPLRPLPEEG